MQVLTIDEAIEYFLKQFSRHFQFLVDEFNFQGPKPLHVKGISYIIKRLCLGKSYGVEVLFDARDIDLTVMISELVHGKYQDVFSSYNDKKIRWRLGEYLMKKKRKILQVNFKEKNSLSKDYIDEHLEYQARLLKSHMDLFD